MAQILIEFPKTRPPISNQLIDRASHPTDLYRLIGFNLIKLKGVINRSVTEAKSRKEYFIQTGAEVPEVKSFVPTINNFILRS